MNQGKTVFAQIISFVPRYEFYKCVKRYDGNRYTIKYNSRDQFIVMGFAPFSKQISLRSINATHLALSSKLYFSGIKHIQRSILAHINETKNRRINNDFAQILNAWVRDLYRDKPSRLDVDGIIYAFDNSTHSSSVCNCVHGLDSINKKSHTLLDLHGAIPKHILTVDVETVLFERKPMDKLFVKPKPPKNDHDFDQMNLWKIFHWTVVLIKNIKTYHIYGKERRT